jgi:ubiquinone biosynthesis protein
MGAGELVGGEGPVRPKDTFANLMTCLRVLAIVVVHLLAESPRIIGALIRRRPADVEIGIGRALASAAEALGPLFVKLAQMMSYRIDLLPAALVGQMARLQDRVGHRGEARALREFIEGPLQRSLGGRVLATDVNPFASGSIATVHRGRMHDGASVAIKIVRRGVADRLRRDTECARWIIGFVARAKFLKGIPVVATFDQMARIIRSQADMLSEARTLARFRDGFSGGRGPRVPKVYDEYTTRDLLVMELIEGASLFFRSVG